MCCFYADIVMQGYRFYADKRSIKIRLPGAFGK